MRINGIPIHVARAYGASPAQRAAPVKPAAPAANATANAPSTRQPDSLIAAKVPGGVDFQSVSPTTAANSFSLYTRAADRVEAAVGVELGRTLDVRG